MCQHAALYGNLWGIASADGLSRCQDGSTAGGLTVRRFRSGVGRLTFFGGFWGLFFLFRRLFRRMFSNNIWKNWLFRLFRRIFYKQFWNYLYLYNLFWQQIWQQPRFVQIGFDLLTWTINPCIVYFILSWLVLFFSTFHIRIVEVSGSNPLCSTTRKTLDSIRILGSFFLYRKLQKEEQMR